VSHPLTAYTILLCLSLSLSFLDTPSSFSTHTFTHMHVHTCHLYCMSVFCSIQNTLPVHLVHLSTFTQAHTHTHTNTQTHTHPVAANQNYFIVPYPRNTGNPSVQCIQTGHSKVRR